jgi:uncharacterized protein (UPF0248 family)
MDENKLKELKKILVYDKETGLFYKKLKSGTLKPTGSYSGGENGHIVIRVLGLNIKAHRLAWFFEYKEFPEFPIGHKNGIKTDNRPQNLIKIEKGKGIDPDTEINPKIFLKKILKKKNIRNSNQEVGRIDINELNKYKNDIIWYYPVDLKFEPTKVKVIENKIHKNIWHSDIYLQEVDKNNIEIPYKRIIKIYNKRGRVLVKVFGSKKTCMKEWEEE